MLFHLGSCVGCWCWHWMNCRYYCVDRGGVVCIKTSASVVDMVRWWFYWILGLATLCSLVYFFYWITGYQVYSFLSSSWLLQIYIYVCCEPNAEALNKFEEICIHVQVQFFYYCKVYVMSHLCLSVCWC
jgi:hypothetical protein